MEEKQYFTIMPRLNCAIFIDGNYLLSISRSLNIKLDMERLFDYLSGEMFRQRTYWFSALESSQERNNNTYRFLDRLRYIPRTKVYIGRMTKRAQGFFETALRTDAGMALGLAMADVARSGKLDYVILIASDPEYVPAIRHAKDYGVIVKLYYPNSPPELLPHPDLLKNVDERVPLESDFLKEFEYHNYYQEDDEEFVDEDFDELDLDEEHIDIEDDDIGDLDDEYDE